MKFRLMGIIRYLDEKGMMLKIIGKKNGVIINRTMTLPDSRLTLTSLTGIIASLMKVKSGDIKIPEHIKLSLK